MSVMMSAAASVKKNIKLACCLGSFRRTRYATATNQAEIIARPNACVYATLSAPTLGVFQYGALGGFVGGEGGAAGGGEGGGGEGGR